VRVTRSIHQGAPELTSASPSPSSDPPAATISRLCSALRTRTHRPAFARGRVQRTAVCSGPLQPSVQALDVVLAHARRVPAFVCTRARRCCAFARLCARLYKARECSGPSAAAPSPFFSGANSSARATYAKGHRDTMPKGQHDIMPKGHRDIMPKGHRDIMPKGQHDTMPTGRCPHAT
jgi:hypothetical protein